MRISSYGKQIPVSGFESVKSTHNISRKVTDETTSKTAQVAPMIFNMIEAREKAFTKPVSWPVEEA